MNKELRKPNFKIGITHDKSFHADDVFSSALLLLLWPDIKIIRRRNIDKTMYEAKEHVIIYDMGGGEFDHHQQEKELRPDGTPYASFGLLWRKYGIFLMGLEQDVLQIDNVLVKWIDDTDNGGSPNTLTSAIKAFNPCWDEDSNTSNEQFFRAVNLAKEILSNYIRKKKAEHKADKIIEDACKVQRGGLIVLDHFVPIGSKVNEDILYAIYPNSSRKEYILEAVLDRNKKPRKPFDKEAIMASITARIHNNTLQYNSLSSAIDVANTLICGKEPRIDADELKKRILKSPKVYDIRLKKEVQIYGFVVIGDKFGEEKYCPILSNHGMYSLSPLSLKGRGRRIDLMDQYYGMVEYGTERVDNRFSYVFHLDEHKENE